MGAGIIPERQLLLLDQLAQHPAAEVVDRREVLDPEGEPALVEPRLELRLLKIAVEIVFGERREPNEKAQAVQETERLPETFGHDEEAPFADDAQGFDQRLLLLVPGSQIDQHPGRVGDVERAVLERQVEDRSDRKSNRLLAQPLSGERLIGMLD